MDERIAVARRTALLKPRPIDAFGGQAVASAQEVAAACREYSLESCARSRQLCQQSAERIQQVKEMLHRSLQNDAILLWNDVPMDVMLSNDVLEGFAAAAEMDAYGAVGIVQE